MIWREKKKMILQTKYWDELSISLCSQKMPGGMMIILRVNAAFKEKDHKGGQRNIVLYSRYIKFRGKYL